MSDLAQLRRWQADEYEKKNQPRLGELNIPQILRDDADEIERLREYNDRSMSVCQHLTIRGLTKGINRVYCASCDNEYWIPSEALGTDDA